MQIFFFIMFDYYKFTYNLIKKINIKYNYNYIIILKKYK